MELFDEIRLKRQLEQDLLPVYMLFGEDDYLVKLYEKKISSLAVGDNPDFNLHVFDSPKGLQGVYDAAAQLPMMNDRSCVLVKDFDLPKCKADDFSRLCEIVSAGFDTTVLILSFTAVDIDIKKNANCKKLIEKIEKAGGAVVQLNHRRPEDLIKLLCGSASKRNCTMDALTARYLIESVGQDINTLYSELEKLIGYALQNGGMISLNTIDLVCIKTVEASVYKIQNELLSGNAERALTLIGQLFDAKTDATVIFSTMASAYNEMYLARASLAAKKSAQQTAQDFGYGNRRFVIERAQTNCRRLSGAQLKSSMKALTDCDRIIKNSNAAMAQKAVERLAVELAQIAKSR